ncbi:hypothetical protein QUF76_05020 [Desulfobacterales bacterium HSG16]|nr:hypothetical protein [Desulfobacterales bacterium HSG16]
MRVTEHASAGSNCRGVKPLDNVPASDSRKSDDRANPATYADNTGTCDKRRKP